MKEKRDITIEEKTYSVIISDEHEALLAADAAGRAIIGLWDPKNVNQNLSPAAYVVECLEDIDEEYLEQVVRRKIGLPWMIGESDRLILREFTEGDMNQVIPEKGDMDADKIFYTSNLLKEYIRNQYGFYQYGIWAVVEKESGKIVGKAGINHMDSGEMEIGYHIFTPYRRHGYAKEACRLIQHYVNIHLNCPLYAKIDPSNEASIKVLKACGFYPTELKYSGETPGYLMYVWNY